MQLSESASNIRWQRQRLQWDGLCPGPTVGLGQRFGLVFFISFHQYNNAIPNDEPVRSFWDSQKAQVQKGTR